VDCFIAGRQDGEPLVAHLPAMTERALEHRIAPQLVDSREIGRAIPHARCQHHAPSAYLLAVAELQREAIADGCAADHLARAVLDARVGRQLAAAGGIQLGRGPLVMAEQTADDLRRPVALFVGVDHQRPPAGPAQHQRCAQPRRATADDHALPLGCHAARFADDASSKPRTSRHETAT
jgi:hypothetical protein